MSNIIDTLFLIGNGFDIANNYKTRYSDFISSPYFKSLLNTNELSKIIKGKQDIQKWVNLELELANYSNLLYVQYNGKIPFEITKHFKNEFLELREALFLYIVNVQLSSTTNPTMENLVERWLDELIVENKLAYILDFNYDIVDYRFFSRNPSIQRFFFNGNPNQVHGIASPNHDNKIVLGVDKTNIKCKEHAFLIKEYNRHINDKGYFESIKTATKVIIFGCSLGRTDYRYFMPLFKNKENVVFEIYCYGNQEYTIIKQLIDEYSGNLSLFLKRNDVSFYNSQSPTFTKF